MGYFCLKCGEIYKSNIKDTQIQFENNGKIEDRIWCPKTSCIGQVIEVDDIFLPIIKLLNKKGYYTSFCCSGHVGDNGLSSYISFDDTMHGLPNIPKGYKEEKDSNIYCIRKNYDDKLSEIEIHKLILENAIITLQWAEQLEDIKGKQIMNLVSH